MRAILIAVGCTALGLALGFSLAYFQANGLAGQPPKPVGPAAPEPPPLGDPQPRVEVDNEEYDFGEMERNGSGEHAFVITNTGEGDLVLQQGDTTCKCTVSQVTNNRLAPGQKALVTLRWTAESRSDFFEQSAQIFTNDRRRRHIILKVRGKLTRPFVAVPEQLNFGDITAGETKTAQTECYVFRPSEAGSLRYELLQPETARYFEVTQEEISHEDFERPTALRGYRLSVKTKSGLPLGPIRQTIRLRIEGETTEPLDVLIVGRVVGDFAFAGRDWEGSTRAIRIGVVNKGKSAARTLIISVRGPQRDETQIHVVEVYPKFLDVKLSKTTGRKGADVRIFPLVIKIPKGQLPGDFRGVGQKPGRIVLETNHPQVKQIEILVRFLIE
jgi:hypothetical protein